MRIIKPLIIAALLSTGTLAVANAQANSYGNTSSFGKSFDNFDLGSNGAARQAQIEHGLRNDGRNSNASVIAPARSTVKPAVHFERK